MKDPYTHLSKGLPLEIELMFPNPTSRRGKEGPVHRISFEVEKQVVDAFMLLPGNIRLNAVVYVVQDDETSGVDVAEPPAEKPVKEKAVKPKGPYSDFWQALCGRKDSLLSAPIIRAWIDEQRAVPTSKDEEVLRSTFLVESRSQISPDEFIRRLEDELPHSDAKKAVLIALERLAANKAAEKETACTTLTT